MKLYKFRTTYNFEYLVDILLNKRLYCADHRDLNDVFEADYRVGKDTGREKEFIDKMNDFSKRIKEYRICSLTKTFDNHQLWAYYADSHKGIAIELDIPENHPDLFEIDYSDEFIFFDELVDSYNDKESIIKPLTRKKSSWNSEQEARLITKNEFFDIKDYLRSVIIGSRMSSNMSKVLYSICQQIDAPLKRAVVADSGFYEVGLQEPIMK